MKNLLVPVDFSEPAKHAAQYAMALASHINAERMTLYNAFQQPMPTDPLLLEPSMNAMEIYNISDLGEISREHLERFKETIAADAPPGLQLEAIGEYNALTEGIQEVCASQHINLVITGITVGDKLTEALVGSHALDIAKTITTPVLIVPQEAGYKPIENILFACDYKQVAETTPVWALANMVTATKAKLHVVHVKETGKQDEEMITGSTVLKTLLQDISPSFYELEGTDFIDTINRFIDEHHIDLIVAIPKKHGFFEGWFRKRHVKTLAFHTHIPLMLIHED